MRGGINLYKSLNGIFHQTKKATGEKRGGFGALVFPRFFLRGTAETGARAAGTKERTGEKKERAGEKKEKIK